MLSPKWHTDEVRLGLKQALKDEDRDTLCSTLNMARAAIVQELATISTESAASINPAVVRLQMLDCLADGFELQGQATFQQPGVHQGFLDVVLIIWRVFCCSPSCHGDACNK